MSPLIRPVEKIERIYDVSEITDAFCQSVPLELTRKCLAAQLFADPACRRRGYLLDVWGSEVLLEGKAAACKLSTCLSASAAEPEDSAEEAAKREITSVRRLLDAVVEIQVFHVYA